MTRYPCWLCMKIMKFRKQWNIYFEINLWINSNQEEARECICREVKVVKVVGCILVSVQSCWLEGICPSLIHFYSQFTFSVLVFPPVNNYRRFLIHKVSEDYSNGLCTFSIGQGHGRRTVLCFKKDLIR